MSNNKKFSLFAKDVNSLISSFPNIKQFDNLCVTSMYGDSFDVHIDVYFEQEKKNDVLQEFYSKLERISSTYWGKTNVHINVKMYSEFQQRLLEFKNKTMQKEY